MIDQAYYPGLEGVIAGETAISSIAGGLRYRGYSIEDLAEQSSFIETAFLLLHGELPNQEQLADFRAILAEASEVEPTVLEFLAGIPFHVPLMDVLRTGVSAVAHFDVQLDDSTEQAHIAKALRLLAQIPMLMAARYRDGQGLASMDADTELSYSGNLLYLLTGEEPSTLAERAFDVSMILYAEHEFNASTFTARIVASTLSDLHSAITAAVGALKGPLHGGANERVLGILEEVESPAEAERWVRDALAHKRRIMGFGHRIYRDCDPRAVILKGYCRQLAEETNQTHLEEIAETIERIVWEEKGLPPNLDWPSARLYHYLGLNVELFTPLFVCSRLTGWAAHYIEQCRHNRLIRPRSQYIGVGPRKYVPVSERGA